MSDETSYPTFERDRMSSREDGASHMRPVPPHRDTSLIDSNNSLIEETKPAPLHNHNIMMDENALIPDVGTEADFEVQNNPFAFTPGQLNKMLNPKSLSAFFALGGLDGLEKGLRTDRKAGLSVDETVFRNQVSFEEATAKENPPVKVKVGTGAGAVYQDRRRVFNENRLPEKKHKSLRELTWDAYCDKDVILLSFAAVASIAVALYDSFCVEHDSGRPPVDWVEGVAIIMAIAIVVVIGAVNDYLRECRFAELNKKKEGCLVKVVRSGKTMEISVQDILVGDVLHLEPGDLVPVDGVLIDGHNLKCDESSATGESDLIRKQSADDVYAAIENYGSLTRMDPFIISGSRIMEGVGACMTTATGVHSSYGKTVMALREEPETVTPLQARLNAIADHLATIGGLATLLLSILPTWPPLNSAERGNPMLHHPKACEGTGNATATFRSYKIDSRTWNEMHVESGAIGISHRFDGAQSRPRDPGSRQRHPRDDGGDSSVSESTSALSADVKDLLIESIAVNSTAFEGDIDGKATFIGSRTEVALLSFARTHLGMGPVSEERQAAHVQHVFPFDSRRKCMGIVAQTRGGRARLYVKGASEIIHDRCDRTIRDRSADYTVAPLTPEEAASLARLTESYAKRSLQTISLSYRDFESWPPPDARQADNDEIAFEETFRHMTFVGLVGIRDPLRHCGAEAAEACHRAGIPVQMVIGDTRMTASAIAKECGILQSDRSDGVVMEGPVFRRLPPTEIAAKLQVLARASPKDKRVLLQCLNEMGNATGNATSDTSVFKLADFDFSMEISRTEVAKEASSVIVIDDKFASIAKGSIWGLALMLAGKRFVRSQLQASTTAALSVLLVAVSGASQYSVLTAVQLLWVNLIMDTLAALSLAAKRHDEILHKLDPKPRDFSIVSTRLWKLISRQTSHPLVIMLLLIYYSKFKGALLLLPIPNSDPPHDQSIRALLGGSSQVLVILLGRLAFLLAGNSHGSIKRGIAVFMSFLPGAEAVSTAIPLALGRVLISLVPGFLKDRAFRLPWYAFSGEEMGTYPKRHSCMRDEPGYLWRPKGGHPGILTSPIYRLKDMLWNCHARDPAGSVCAVVRASALSLPF